jgi:hypothetical protein
VRESESLDLMGQPLSYQFARELGRDTGTNCSPRGSLTITVLSEVGRQKKACLPDNLTLYGELFRLFYDDSCLYLVTYWLNPQLQDYMCTACYIISTPSADNPRCMCKCVVYMRVRVLMSSIHTYVLQAICLYANYGL